LSALESRLSNARKTNENKGQHKFVGNSKEFIILVCIIKQPLKFYNLRREKAEKKCSLKGAVNCQDYVESVLDEYNISVGHWWNKKHKEIKWNYIGGV
jgi:hypothetical protein